ncbi:uncharacterized protein LODBEIA_P05790 [Lodderomyces beijingensis]|uniref:6-phosphofructo-2-kinase domain-containing protein n=1 Tax=Lodderomyces beijingensis TaxID=1775926 RepID=A0ABP0ZDV7_9ASCO
MSPNMSFATSSSTNKGEQRTSPYKHERLSKRHSYGGEKLSLSKSLDSQLLEPFDSNTSLSSFLPEFNKRPLTDTPIVSHTGSPQTRDQSSDDEDDDDHRSTRAAPGNGNRDEKEEQEQEQEEKQKQDDQQQGNNDEKSTKEKGSSSSVTKKISHLNLAELGDESNSPASLSETESLNKARNAAAHAGASLVGTQDSTFTTNVMRPTFWPSTSEPGARPSIMIAEERQRSDSVSPMSSISESQKKRFESQSQKDKEIEERQLRIEMEQEKQRQKQKQKQKSNEGNSSGLSSPSERSLTMNENIKERLLKDVPLEMKEQFEKTPSIEKLKSLLLTKPPPSARKTYTLNIPGQTSSKTSPDGKIAAVDVGSKVVIVMVGLPARGKSYITNKLTRYLNWLQHDCRVFNVGNTRRKSKLNAGPEKNPLPDASTPTEAQSPDLDQSTKTNGAQEHDASFFNPENKDSTALREKWAMDTLDQLLDYVINGSGSVGIFDATNSTKLRRKRVLKRIQERSNGELKVLFLESICSDPSIIESNIRLKLSGPDYKNMDPEVALKDFVGRLQNYEKAYETIDAEEEKIPGFQYIKMIDVGKKVVSYNIQGFLSSQTVYFLLNFNLCERQIWITRHGESKDNLSGRIGGDSRLTKRGLKFAATLAKFMNFQRENFRKQQLERFSSRLELKFNSIFNENDAATLDMIPTEPNFCVWTSMLIRAVETGQYFNEQLYSVKQMRMLNELGGGKYDGMTYDEIQMKHPKEFEARLNNKLTYRYPGVGGESYLDVLTRLRPLITEIERTTDHLLIISHRVVLRILLAYFLNLDTSAIGELDIPLHTLYCLESKPYGTDYTMYEYDEATDWFNKVEPEHQKNIKEVGVVFKERKYSIVPTAPPSRNRISSFANANVGDQLHNLRRGHGHAAAPSSSSPPVSSVADPAKTQDLGSLRNNLASTSPSTRPTLSVRDGDSSAAARNLRDLKLLELSTTKKSSGKVA